MGRRRSNDERQFEALDSTIVRDATLSDIDPEAVRVYRELRREANPDAEELTWSDSDLLRSLGALTIDGEVPRPTVTGIILFGSAMAIVRLVRFPGWQQTAAGEREVKKALRKSLLKYQLHQNTELFDKAYGYVKQYY